MLKDPRTHVDLSRSRTVGEIVRSSVSLVAGSPGVFAVLAAAVVVPFELIVYAVTGTAPLGQTSNLKTAIVVLLIGFLLIGPLLSALYANALTEIAHGVAPSLRGVVADSLRALPVVVAAQIIAGIAVGIGLFAFIVPGVILAVRLAVVAQVAALEGTDWPGALRRAATLTHRHGWHILGLILCVYLVNLILTQLGVLIAGEGSNALQLIVGILVALVVQSFQAVTLAVLYFDLLARERTG
jgi:hypothetical protein